MGIRGDQLHLHLLKAKRHNQICVIVDGFTKLRQYIGLKQRATVLDEANAVRDMFTKFMDYPRREFQIEIRRLQVRSRKPAASS